VNRVQAVGKGSTVRVGSLGTGGPTLQMP
jgi:hypothetical protein